MLIILFLLKKLGKWISRTYMITFLCNFTQIEVIGKILGVGQNCPSPKKIGLKSLRVSPPFKLFPLLSEISAISR